MQNVGVVGLNSRSRISSRNSNSSCWKMNHQLIARNTFFTVNDSFCVVTFLVCKREVVLTVVALMGYVNTS